MAEFDNPEDNAARIAASEASTSASGPRLDLAAGLSTTEPPCGHPALVKLKQYIHANPIGSVVAAFVLGFIIARLFS